MSDVFDHRGAEWRPSRRANIRDATNWPRRGGRDENPGADSRDAARDEGGRTGFSGAEWRDKDQADLAAPGALIPSA
ncbi:hypothetical protein [uncultured Deinococcus sp.]|uniref:hypothetical protein n=1 Tax=uncultured Deinococcus sp. TaxID=158789 RepID=UPI00258B6800|nr:hypothetical protein [uncultured Deinococcus sp.]